MRRRVVPGYLRIELDDRYLMSGHFDCAFGSDRGFLIYNKIRLENENRSKYATIMADNAEKYSPVSVYCCTGRLVAYVLSRRPLLLRRTLVRESEAADDQACPNVANCRA
jgi:hypothetical protein